MNDLDLRPVGVRGWAVAGLVAILLVALQIFLIGPAIRHVLPAGLIDLFLTSSMPW
jgi:hypothetical protein